ncbi:MAG: DUF4256 domain-containing protein, partial [Chloroflexota bacterium]
MGKGKSGSKLERIQITKNITNAQGTVLLETLKARFTENTHRHEGIVWAGVESRLTPEKLAALHAMETTGGEPDVVGHNADTDEYLFMDCSPESPTGRRSICYDGAAEAERHKKKVYPAGNAVELATAMGIALLTE